MKHELALNKALTLHFLTTSELPDRSQRGVGLGLQLEKERTDVGLRYLREKAKVPLPYNIHQFSQATGGEVGHHDNELRPR